MKVYSVYFYHSEWSDSFELDRKTFLNKETAVAYEKQLTIEHEEELEDEDYNSIQFEEIDIITD